MRHRDRHSLRRVFAVGVVLLAPLTFLLAWWRARPDLPDRMATHFTISGEPDGFAGTGWFVAGLAGCLLLLGALAVLLVSRREPVRYLLATVAAAAWLVAPVGVSVMRAAQGVSDSAHTHLSMLWVLLGFAAAALAVAAVWFLVGAEPVSATGGSEQPPPYRLGASEKAVWVGHASSTPLRVLAAVLLVLAAVGWAVDGWAATLVPLLVALVVLWFSTITLRIDGRGLVAHYGPVAFPRMRVALDRVESAESVERIRPLEWGGWGLRITPRGTGMIVRGGPAIVVHRSGRNDLAVSVDQPQQGVDLLRALQARVRPGD